MQIPKEVKISWKQVYRIIPSRIPPINVFENLVEPSQLDALFELECMTNERLRDEVHLHHVPQKDRITGPGASPLMAAFTHISTFKPTRFSDGTYGVYYAAKTIETAVKETVFHAEKFMRHTHEPPCELERRVYINRIQKPLFDLRDKAYQHMHHPSDYQPSQSFALQLKQEASPWGLVYNSVRDNGGACVAIFRPPALTLPTQSQHLYYDWDGEKIANVYTKQVAF